METTQAQRIEPQAIQAGDRVFFKPEWMDKGDELHTFIATEEAIEGYTLDVVCASSTLHFKPHQRVRLHMIDYAERA